MEEDLRKLDRNQGAIETSRLLENSLNGANRRTPPPSLAREDELSSSRGLGVAVFFFYSDLCTIISRVSGNL